VSDHPLTGFLAVAPSTVRAGERFDLRLKCLTTPHHVPVGAYVAYPRLAGPFNLSPRGIRYMDNVASRWDGSLEFDSGAAFGGPHRIDCDALTGAFEGDGRALGAVSGFSFDTPGCYTIKITDPLTGISGKSNIIEVSEHEPGWRLYWGDLHSQTFFSDGLRVPEELYHFAHHEGFLDIFALADHCEWLTDDQWDYFTRVTNRFYRPGHYVTLVGLEWTHRELGHRCVYYPGDGGPILRSTEQAADSLPKLYAAAREHGALVIPHHSANAEMGVDWDGPHDAEQVRLVEIYSVWGNSECRAERGNSRPIRVLGGERAGRHVADALQRGLRLGFIGGGDIHDGRPGDDLHALQESPEMYRRLYRQGTMGVWARKLTREAVWEALWNRRVYATTNSRIIVRFEVCDAFMGETAVTAGPRAIRIQAASAAGIKQAQVIRDGEVLATVCPSAPTIHWEMTDDACDGPSYYYARISDAAGEMAWSSPVWVEARDCRSEAITLPSVQAAGE
jgi:hypothetical protein